MLNARSSDQLTPNTNMSSPTMVYASPYPNAPPGFRNSTFGDAATGSQIAGAYGSGWVASSPHPDNQPTHRQTTFDIISMDDVPGQYGHVMPGVHPGNNTTSGMMPHTRGKSPGQVPPYELSAASTGVHEDGARTATRYQSL
jgi:hypothetical protein